MIYIIFALWIYIFVVVTTYVVIKHKMYNLRKIRDNTDLNNQTLIRSLNSQIEKLHRKIWFRWN